MFRLTPARRAGFVATPIAVVTALATLLTLAAAPAHAQTRRFDDPDSDMTSGQQVHPGDIQKVTVSHQTRLQVAVAHHDLQSDAAVGTRLFIDTTRDRPGAELVLTAGLSDGADYQLHRAHNWTPYGDALTCFHHVQVDYTDDVSRLTLGRACLGDTREVRVALRVSGPSSEAVDWLASRRAFTPTITR